MPMGWQHGWVQSCSGILRVRCSSSAHLLAHVCCFTIAASWSARVYRDVQVVNVQAAGAMVVHHACFVIHR